MTAGQQVSGILAAAQGLNFLVGVGTNGPSFGFSSGGYGSVTPGTYKGLTIITVQTGAASDMILTISGIASNGINGIIVRDTAGNWRNMPASAASFAASAWTWGTGASKVFTATSPATRELIIY